MTIIAKSRVMPYSCEQMYNLVNEVESYQDFLPHFDKTIVHYRDEDEVHATLVVSMAGLQKSFSTRNRLQKNRIIEIRLVDGPFSHLEGFWRFEEVDEGCNIVFDLEFQFSSRMVAMLFEPFFEQITNTMFDSFCSRADALYAQN